MENQNYNPSSSQGGDVPKSSDQEMSVDGKNKKVIVAFLLGIIIGFGSFWLWDKDKTDDIGDTEDNDKEIISGDDIDKDGASNIGTSANSLSVQDQVAGDQVLISKVILESAGWVAIQDDEGGVPGRILGAQRFDAGEFSGAVELLRATVSGNSYHAVLRYDDGVEGFDPILDLPLTDSLDNIILDTFRVLES